MFTNYKPFKYILSPSTSHHLRLTVHPDGRVVVSVPKHAKPADVERFVRSKEKWVTEKLAYFKARTLKRQKQTLQFQDELRRKYGEFGKYAEYGKYGALNEYSKNHELEPNFLHAPPSHLLKSSQKNLRKSTQKKQYLLHKEEARSLVATRLTHWQNFFYDAGIDLRYGRFCIKNQRSRWGSCSRHKDGTANLNFNWRLVQLPAMLADYIVIHELAHLKEMNHSARFWKLVAMAMPEFATARADLRKMSMLGVG